MDEDLEEPFFVKSPAGPQKKSLWFRGCLVISPCAWRNLFLISPKGGAGVVVRWNNKSSFDGSQVIQNSTRSSDGATAGAGKLPNCQSVQGSICAKEQGPLCCTVLSWY